jgi:hypothetical protein
MNTYADNNKENKKQQTPPSIQKKNNGAVVLPVANSPSVAAQMQLQEIANNSPQVQQAIQLQVMANTNSALSVQKKGNEDEEILQKKFAPIQKKANNTGLPDNLKSGIENLSGHSIDDVKVYYNSNKPAQLNAHAYAQGSEIHLASGQEKHLPHEAWHVVQQKQGRVKPTMQMKGKVNVNDDAGLEKEADVMGDKAFSTTKTTQLKKNAPHEGVIIQRVTLAVGELQEAAHKQQQLSPKKKEHEKVITDAEASYLKNNPKEKQVHPWDERFRPFYSGPLAGIGSENLRIYGHGQVYVGNKAVSMIGGYTASALCQKLIEMGLPANYKGEIYLTGCETAVGRGRGYLGAFYTLISGHCSGVTVRGNMGTTVTHPDGVQGIWTGVMSLELFEGTRAGLVAKKDFYLKKNSAMRIKNKQLSEQNNLLKKERQIHLAKVELSKKETDEFLEKEKKFNEVCLATSKAAIEIADYLKMIVKGLNELDYIAYDRSGRLSVTLPAGFNETENIKAALAETKKLEEFRLTKLEIAEELASIYGWAESEVTKQVHGGELDERATDRMQARKNPPSYIS